MKHQRNLEQQFNAFFLWPIAIICRFEIQRLLMNKMLKRMTQVAPGYNKKEAGIWKQFQKLDLPQKYWYMQNAMWILIYGPEFKHRTDFIDYIEERFPPEKYKEADRDIIWLICDTFSYYDVQVFTLEALPGYLYTLFGYLDMQNLAYPSLGFVPKYSPGKGYWKRAWQYYVLKYPNELGQRLWFDKPTRKLMNHNNIETALEMHTDEFVVDECFRHLFKKYECLPDHLNEDGDHNHIIVDKDEYYELIQKGVNSTW